MEHTDITFTRKVEGEGKSGYFTMNGLFIRLDESVKPPFPNPIIKIWAYNSRGKLAPCKIEIPIEQAEAVAKALLKLAGK